MRMPQETSEVIKWLNLADNDYLSARLLIRRGLLIQGTILSSTSIEKYLKTVCKIKRISFKTQGEKAHNVNDLYNLIKDEKSSINEDYLALLVNAYKLRYPDRLAVEYNIALNQAKALVGLDEAVFKIRSRIKLIGAERRSLFEEQIAQKDELLCQGNHAFGDANRDDLFKDPVACYEMRELKNGVWMEAHYIAIVNDDDKYNVEGLKTGSSDLEYKLQNAPIDLSKK